MTTYSPEMRERALRMLAEARPDHPNRWTAIRHVAGLLGMSPETLRLWQRKVEVDAGTIPGVTTEAAKEIKRLKRENAELRRANEILKSASVFFAGVLSGLRCPCRSISFRVDQGVWSFLSDVLGFGADLGPGKERIGAVVRLGSAFCASWLSRSSGARQGRVLVVVPAQGQ